MWAHSQVSLKSPSYFSKPLPGPPLSQPRFQAGFWPKVAVRMLKASSATPLAARTGYNIPIPHTATRPHIAASSGRARTVPAASCHRHVQSHLRACGARAACPATFSSSPTTMATSRTHLPPAQPKGAARRAPFEFSPGLLELSSWLVFARTLGALSPPHPLRPRPTCA
jgi:hypothetical protein